MSELQMFGCHEYEACLVVAADPDHAKRLLRDHHDLGPDVPLEIHALPPDEVLEGWCNWDQERQTNVYASPAPTVAQALADGLKPGVLSGDVDDAIYDTPDGQPLDEPTNEVIGGA